MSPISFGPFALDTLKIFRKLSYMIDNSDKVGCWQVTITANKNVVNCFQCPTLEDVREEVVKILDGRNLRGLPSTKVVARQLLEKGRTPLEWKFGPETIIHSV